MGNKRGLIKGVNDLVTTMPDIAAQWDYEKNGDLKPEDVMAGSNDRVWWKCERGHEWQTAVYHRKAGHGCPFCSAAKIRPGRNDLAAVNPKLASEWDYEKNTGISPVEITPYSQKSVWWKCSYGHSWKNTVSHRTFGEGCPYCSGNRVLQGFNDLATTMPELVAQWDYEKNGKLKPEDVMAGSSDLVWWRCEKGHSWKAHVYSRKAGYGCPYCAGNAVSAGDNDLATKASDLLSEWDYEKNGEILPEEISPNSNRRVWWRCREGHSWKAAVYSRTGGKGCPYCSNHKILPGFNDLASLNPELASEWDYELNTGLSPSDVMPSSHRKIWWKGPCGHKWQASVADRNQGNGCPYCTGRKVLIGFNDLASQNPDLASEWDYNKNADLTPQKVTVSSNRRVWWKCENGHSWQAAVYARMHEGCPYCSNRKVLEGYNDLATYDPELASEWDYEKNHNRRPETIMYRSDQKVWWRCVNGHSWKASVYKRYIGEGCPYCVGRKAFPGLNDLKTVLPQLAEEWDYERNYGINPEEIMPYTNRKFWWVCKNGHHWKSTVNSRSQGAGCPYCSGLIPKHTHIVT